MDTEKRLGIILIIIGLLIPLAALPFVSGFSKDKGLYDNFYKAGIDIRKASKDYTIGQSPVNSERPKSRAGTLLSTLIPQRIPFRFFFIPTVILAYMGIIRIERSRRKKHDH